VSADRPSPAGFQSKDLAELRKLWRRHQQERERQARLARERAAAEAAERREVHGQELTLLREALRGVVPLAPITRADTGRSLPEPEPRQRQLDEARVLQDAISDDFDPLTLLETDDELSWRRDGIGMDVMAKLRRGTWVVQGQVDLHGLTRDAARGTLAQFLARAGKQGWRCVRVVHGKGLGSPGRQPVLKGKVRHWLVQRDEVLAFTQARGPDGGAGALIVLLDSYRRAAPRPPRPGTARPAAD
jgi:DNA-nicking Smr family endonuclease